VALATHAEHVAGSLDEETRRAPREWRADHEGEGLNRLQAMIDPLQATFRMQRPALFSTTGEP
jgi:hypothetical protein